MKVKFGMWVRSSFCVSNRAYERQRGKRGVRGSQQLPVLPLRAWKCPAVPGPAKAFMGPGGNENVGLLLKIKNDRKAKQGITPCTSLSEHRAHAPEVSPEWPPTPGF